MKWTKGNEKHENDKDIEMEEGTRANGISRRRHKMDEGK
jgi:hypothetical protein